MSKSKRVSSKRLISAASTNWLTEKNDDYYFDIKKYKRSIFIYDPRDLDCSPPPEVQLLQITSTSRETPQSIAINPLSILTQNEDGPLVGAGPSTPGNKKIDHIKNAEEPVIRWKKLKFSKDSYEEMFEKSFIKETFIPDVDAGEYTLIDLLNSLAKRLHLTFRERLNDTKNFKAWIQLRNNYRKTKDHDIFEMVISTKPYVINNEFEIEDNIRKCAEYILERNSLVMRETSGVVYQSTSEIMIKTTKFTPLVPK